MKMDQILTPPLVARGVVLVRDGVTGKPKFDLPFGEYPEWARAVYRTMLTVEELAEVEGRELVE